MATATANKLNELQEEKKNNNEVENWWWVMERYETWTSMAQCREQMQIPGEHITNSIRFGNTKHSSLRSTAHTNKAEKYELSRNSITCVNFHEYVDIIACQLGISVSGCASEKATLFRFHQAGKWQNYAVFGYFRRCAIYDAVKSLIFRMQ